VISWPPSEAQGPRTNVSVTVVADDNPWAVNAQHLSATNSFTVMVGSLRMKSKAIGRGDGLFNMVANRVSGQAFTLQASADPSSWTDLVTTNAAEATLTLQDRAARLARKQFCRLKRIQ